MKVHLNWLRHTAAAAIAAVGTHSAFAQVAPQQTTYNYPTTTFQSVSTSGIVPPGRAPVQSGAPSYAPSGPSATTYLPSTGSYPQVAMAPTQATPTYQPAPSYQPTYQPAQPTYQGGVQGYSVNQAPGMPYRPQGQYGTVSGYPTAQPTYVALGDKKENGKKSGDGQNGDEPLPPPTNGATPEYLNGAGGADDSGINGYPGTPGYEAARGAACNTPDYGIRGYFDNPAYDSQWFGGIYFLYMGRDNPGYTRFTSEVDTGSIMYPYYPQARTTVLSTDDIDYDFAPGLELRFGATFCIGDSFGPGHGDGWGPGYGGSFGNGACGPSNCGSCAPVDHYAWEVVWWGLLDDDQSATVMNDMPDGPMRLYGLRTHAGLMYDSAGGARPVNDYYDYQMPIEDDMPPMPDDVRVIEQRVRTYFSAQNIELNFLRFPVCTIGAGGCATGGCATDACGYDAAGTVCAPSTCEPASCFSIVGVCGFRYFRTDDDFMWSNRWATYDGGGFMPSMDELFHEIQIDNQLVGFQLGSSMNYAVGCRWNFFLDSTFGVFNNHINHYQRVYGANGNYAYYEETGEGMVVESTKNDVAFLGELRLGGAYNISCNWRAVMAYRAIGVTGLALSTDQLRDEYSNWADTARIDSDGSMILHGVQIGAECKY